MKALVLLVAGCVVPATLSTRSAPVGSTNAAPAAQGSPVVSTNAAPAADPTSTPSPTPSPPSRARPTVGFHDAPILRDQIERIEGMPIEQAKAELAKLGFEGKIYLQDGAYIDGCKADTVCRIQPGSGFSSHAEIFFVVNPKLQISAPP